MTDRSVWQNFRDVFAQPSATFDDVAEQPNWWAPLLVILAVTVVVSYLMLPMFLEVQALEVERSVPPAERAQALEQIETFGGTLGFLLSVAATPFVLVIMAFLFWAMALISAAQNARYGVAFTALTYAGVAYVVQGIAQAFVVVIKGADIVAREGGPPHFGVGLFLEKQSLPPLVWGFLANINLFSIWYAALLGIAGVHALKMERGPAYAFAMTIWVVGSLMMART